MNIKTFQHKLRGNLCKILLLSLGIPITGLLVYFCFLDSHHLEFKIKTDVEIESFTLCLLPADNGEGAPSEAGSVRRIMAERIIVDQHQTVSFSLPRERIKNVKMELPPLSQFNARVSEVRLMRKTLFGLHGRKLDEISLHSIRGNESFQTCMITETKDELLLETVSSSRNPILELDFPSSDILTVGGIVSVFQKIFVFIFLVIVLVKAPSVFRQILDFSRKKRFYGTISDFFSRMFPGSCETCDNTPLIARILSKILFYFAFFVMSLIFLISLYYHLTFFTGKLSSIQAIQDCFGAVILLVILLFILGKIKINEFSKKCVETGSILYVLIFGTFFISLAGLELAPVRDSEAIFRVANNEGLDYLFSYPYQSFFAFLCRISGSLWGERCYLPFCIFNLFSLCLLHFSVFRITDSLFKNNAVNIVVALLLVLFFPYLYYLVVIYPDFPASSFFLAGLAIFLRLDRTTWRRYFIAALVVLLFSAMLKHTNLLLILFLVPFAGVHWLYSKDCTKFVFTTFCIISLFIFQAVFVQFYASTYTPELRQAKPVPKVAFLAMGLQSGDYVANPSIDFVTSPKKLNEYKRPVAGVWNGFISKIREDNLDSEDRMREESWKSIGKSLNAFVSDPGYAFDFFLRKIIYVWADNNYMSRPILHPGEGYMFGSPAVSFPTEGNHPVLASLLDSNSEFRRSIEFLGGARQFLIHFFAMLGFSFLARNGDAKKNQYALSLAIIVSGGFVFYLFWEVMPRYALPFIPFFIIMAAYGIVRFSTIFNNLRLRLRSES